MLTEARRLFDLGWAVHWIQPQSKKPVKAGWTGGVRDDWATVERDYRKGYGLGVRLGAASRLPCGNYLANIDVDIKSDDPRHRSEALAQLKALYPAECKTAAVVKTSYGLRLFVRTPEPVTSRKLAQSRDECVVLMPTQPVNRKQLAAVARGVLTEEQLKAGYRVRAAWELELMSVGRQVVLPPSIHPETRKPYVWQRPLDGAKPLPLVVTTTAGNSQETATANNTTKAPQGVAQKFSPVNVDIISGGLPDDVIDMILTGAGVEDHSAACYKVALTMAKLKFSNQEILSVLTDRNTYLGDVAYEHAGNTASRQRAARWVQKYCIDKARITVSPQHAFAVAAPETPERHASAEEQAEEAEQLESGWQSQLERGRAPKDGGEAKPIPSLRNTVLVLENAIGKNVFMHDEFRFRDAYGVKAPWVTSKVGKAIDDKDGAHIVLWISQRFRFEPADHVVAKAVTVIADQNAFHPVRDELEELPEWDGLPRIDTWFQKNFNAKGPDEYLAQVLRKWMVASVTRVYEPGTKFDWMPILQGKQGTGKSSFGSILFGSTYVSDWLPALHDKDAALQLQGRRCHEFGELDSMRKNEIDTIKAFLTRTTDKVRPPYGRRVMETDRQVVFFGTTNRDTYLKDDSGNRRFIPVEVGRLNFKALHRDRAQLWAEALWIYRNGFEATLELEGEAYAYSKTMQEQKMVEDDATFMVDEFERFFTREAELAKKNPGGGFDFKRFKMVTLFDGMGPFAKWKPTGRSLQFAGKALRTLGAVKTTTHGVNWWHYEPKKDPKKDPE